MFRCDAGGNVSERDALLPGGVNATDAVIGDFDGDGRDEVAVLAYGVGLNHMTRGDEGGILVYKWIDDAWQKAWQIDVPHPRIGLASDIDQDGCQELIVSLFFANRLVVVDFCAGNSDAASGGN